MIGYFGNIKFVASSDKLLSFGGLNVTTGSVIAQHPVIGAKPVVEFVGFKNKIIKMDIVLLRTLTDDIIGDVERFQDMILSKSPYPLTIGEKHHGFFYIEDFVYTYKFVSNEGIPEVVELSLSLTED